MRNIGEVGYRIANGIDLALLAVGPGDRHDGDVKRKPASDDQKLDIEGSDLWSGYLPVLSAIEA